MFNVLVAMTSVSSAKVLEVLPTSITMLVAVSPLVLMECMAYLQISPVWIALVGVKHALEEQFPNVKAAKTMEQTISLTMALLCVIPPVQMASTPTLLLSNV